MTKKLKNSRSTSSKNKMIEVTKQKNDEEIEEF